MYLNRIRNLETESIQFPNFVNNTVEECRCMHSEVRARGVSRPYCRLHSADMYTLTDEMSQYC